jgi:hypothetical protein
MEKIVLNIILLVSIISIPLIFSIPIFLDYKLKKLEFLSKKCKDKDENRDENW